MVEVESLTGTQIASAIADLARLRIAVFAAWPYLYEGDLAHESEYLREFAASPGAVLVVARAGRAVVGAATAAPMAGQKAAFSAPFREAGLDIEHLFYFGESVLLPSWRGQGVGHAFFDHRERHAQANGARMATFAAVERPVDHPARPQDYVPLDRFWTGRGYRREDALSTTLRWKDKGESIESEKPMRYWLRRF
nr:GNAT family N-acetyltransferase [Novosphingobium sp. 9]